VHNLQCGLDSSAWINGEQECRKFGLSGFSAADAKAGRLPPFDLANAHDLYKALFGKIEPSLKNAVGSWRHLLIVPDPFFSLAFAALVTEDPSGSLFAKGADYQAAKWLGTRQPISILPSVASLKSLRATARQQPAPRPYIGFGNPLLAGNLALSDHVERAKLAGEWQRCADVAPKTVEVASRNVVPLFGGSEIADVALLRAQLPLPETATELCDVAASFGTAAAEMDDVVRLGARAIEPDVKAMSDSGRLAEFRTVHFATHAALAGQVRGTVEPGLILTPPSKGTAADDGYLTASEIAQLKLNADWVILSACNTAGGSGQDTNALSGLARAFFYAGARSLLVSRWAVASNAAVQLIRNAFSEIKTNPTIGRAAAIQLAMKSFVEGAGGSAHPALWAPFFVVGEGAQ
jgi:CHAT domain-containing protein